MSTSSSSLTSAFENGSGVQSNDLYTLIAGAGCVLILLVVAWTLNSAYQGLAAQKLSGKDFGWTCMKGIMLVVLMIWILVPK